MGRRTDTRKASQSPSGEATSLGRRASRTNKLTTRSRRRRWALVGTGFAAGYAVARARRTADMVTQIDSFDAAEPSPDLEGEQRWLTTADGARLITQVAGPEDGPQVVLAHCWTGSQETWAPVARRLVMAGCRVVRWDQRGHGRSEAGELGHTLEGLAMDLATVVEELDIRDAVLAGHSMGGFTIQGFAVHHQELFEERAKAMVLVATAAYGLRSTPVTNVAGVLRHPVTQAFMSRPTLGRVAVRGTFGKTAHPHHLERTRRDFVATDPDVRADFIQGFQFMDLRPGLAEVDKPTTVIAGSRDTLTPPVLNRGLAKAIPGAELRMLKGRGHMLPFEVPDEVASAILEYVDI